MRISLRIRPLSDFASHATGAAFAVVFAFILLECANCQQCQQFAIVLCRALLLQFTTDFIDRRAIILRCGIRLCFNYGCLCSNPPVNFRVQDQALFWRDCPPILARNLAIEYFSTESIKSIDTRKQLGILYLDA